MQLIRRAGVQKQVRFRNGFSGRDRTYEAGVMATGDAITPCEAAGRRSGSSEIQYPNSLLRPGGSAHNVHAEELLPHSFGPDHLK